MVGNLLLVLLGAGIGKIGYGREFSTYSIFKEDIESI
jgi:hypothetical protein